MSGGSEGDSASQREHRPLPTDWSGHRQPVTRPRWNKAHPRAWQGVFIGNFVLLGKDGKRLPHLLQADKVPVTFSLQVDDAPPLLLPLVEPP